MPTRGIKLWHFALALALTGIIALMVLLNHRPPQPLSIDTAATQFSAMRAKQDVAALTAFGPRPVGRDGKPHPESHRLARQWVERRLRELGLTPEVQTGNVCEGGHCSEVENVIARRPAEGAADAREPVVLLSHYDSVARGPGAGDAAAGVATVLEVVRALNTQADWQRPLVVVIDDGEEAGLLGARLLPSHPQLRNVAAVLNHEARGTAGQTAMFETSRHSTWLVEEYGHSVSRPVASSAIYPLYRLLPNDTDLTVLKAAGWRGLNFAFAENEHLYHTANDSLANLDLGSVQHMGDQSLATARALLARKTLPSDDRDGVWFDLFTRIFVLYRTPLAVGLGVLQGLIWLTAVGMLLRRQGRSGFMWLGAGLLRFLAVLVVSALTGLVVIKCIGALSSVAKPWRTSPLPTWLALSSLAVSVASLMQLGACRLSPPSSLRKLWGESLGTLLPWTVLSLLLSLKVTDASYLFTLPALFASLALLVGIWTVDREDQVGAALAVVLGASLPVVAIWLPLIRVLLVMAGANLHIAVTLPWAVLITLNDPLHRLFPVRLRLVVPCVLAILGVCAAVVAGLSH